MLLYLGIGLVVLTLLMGLFLISRYRRCPSDKILVIYGKTGSGSARCLAGGAAFVWPVIQDYEYLDLSPISIDVDLKSALSKQNIRVNVPSRFTVAISNQEGTMLNAAERLLGKTMEDIQNIAKDIIFGQLRLVVATMDIEEINSDRDKFLANVASNVGSELSKIGLTLINVNITDIEDESGYIEALGKEAAAQAVNEARVSVAERNREGSIGEAKAHREQRIEVAKAEAEASIGEASANASTVDGENNAQVAIANSLADRRSYEAEALRLERVRTAEANSLAQVGEAAAQAKAKEGENESAIRIAESDAERRIREAEAEKNAVSAEKIQKANALKEAYLAERDAELARAEKEKASQEADAIVKAKIAQRKVEIEAEAEAERIRLIAKGEADALFMAKEAEARGIQEILQRQADGFSKIVDAARGNSKEAVLLMIADKLPELVRTQVDAIKDLKIDKVTVWEGGQGQGQGEGNSTSKFISGLYKSVPPLHDLFNMAGMDLPTYLGSKHEPLSNGTNGVPKLETADSEIEEPPSE